MPKASELKIPPQDLEAEQSVLGALMIDKDAIFSVADTITSDDFYKKAHADIFEAAIRLWEKHEPIDILSVTAELKRSDKLKEAGGSTYLTELINSVPTSSHIAHYAKIVREKRVLRDLINVSARITENAFSPDDDLDVMLDGIEQKIFAISEKSLARNFVSIKEDLKSAYERIEKLHQGDADRLRGVPTGFTGLDNILSGLQRSDLIIIGARPSQGKTALTLDIARNAALKFGHTVGYFSLEMSREQVIDRLIASEAAVDAWKLRTGRLKDDEDFQMIQAALDKLSRASLFIDDTPSPTIIEMRAMARRLQAEQKHLDLLVVDYLQLVQPRAHQDSVVQQVTEVSRGLKGLARELNVPVIAVSQLSREVDKRDVKIPRLSDLRESGSIEQDADVVLFLYHKNKDRMDLPEDEQNVVEVIVSKHRNGPLGSVPLYFDKQKISFQNIDTAHVDTDENAGAN
ncbi:MAG: replicative DNA helicase [Patescibacteria group bacterium]|nr:replicative DNA helicase [Patescibacteria group bacterium]